MEIKKIHVGESIKRHLHSSNLSKAAFARLIGLSPQNVNALLSRDSLETKRLAKISEALNYNFFAEFVTQSGGDVSVTASGGSHIIGNTMIGGGTTTASTVNNNYGETCSDGNPSPIVATLTESVSTLTRELETSQEQKSQLIRIIDKLTDKFQYGTNEDPRRD